MNNIELVLPAGVERAEFRIEADSMEKLGKSVELLLREVNHNKYGVDVDNLDTRCVGISALQVGVVRVAWGPWTCRITLWRK